MSEKPSGVLDALGRPARRPSDDRCPKCGAGPDERGPSGGFGIVHPVCLHKGCGYEWIGDIWHG